MRKMNPNIKLVYSNENKVESQQQRKKPRLKLVGVRNSKTALNEQLKEAKRVALLLFRKSKNHILDAQKIKELVDFFDIYKQVMKSTLYIADPMLVTEFAVQEHIFNHLRYHGLSKNYEIKLRNLMVAEIRNRFLNKSIELTKKVLEREKDLLTISALNNVLRNLRKELVATNNFITIAEKRMKKTEYVRHWEEVLKPEAKIEIDRLTVMLIKEIDSRGKNMRNVFPIWQSISTRIFYD